MSLFEKVFGTKSERELKKIQNIVDKILSLDSEYSSLSDEELQNKTNVFKERLENGETLDDILPEAFATVREASWRVLGMKPYPVQVQGGIILYQGRIAQLVTGEGKTVVATLPAYLVALEGKGVHIVTVNDYLAKRDSQWMGKVYKFLGLSVGLILHDMPNELRREAYNCDITYGTNNEFGFDYLRDNMVYKVEDMVQRGHHYAIVDEVDSILIDEARTPLIISGFSNETTEGYQKANELVKTLKKKVVVELDTSTKLEKMTAQLKGENIEKDYSDYDYIVEEKKKFVSLTDTGVSKVEKFYNINNLSDIKNIEINHYVTRALKAYGVFKKDIDYVVENGKIIIVDESTGRLMYGRRYSDSIHQAIEAKEDVEIQKESKTLASITFQNFFRKYERLSGMTGTAKTEEEEFQGIYNLDIIEIPTNKPVIRIDKKDKVYLTLKGKMDNIVQTIKECNEKGQPILVGTVSVEKSEELSKLLTKYNIKHNVLNAKYHEKEAQIVAQAGRYGAVTIATNMAGRGTDILLGGNPEYLALQELKSEGYEEELLNEATSYSATNNEEIINIRKLFKEKENRIKEELKEEKEKVLSVGGLYILGTERHESRRIDNQLRGRSGRQGDPGVSEFILSLEDDLMRLFGTEKLSQIALAMNIPENVPIDMGILSNNIEKAQKRIESQYYGIRKAVLEYDEIVSQQRDIVYEERYKVVNGEIKLIPIVERMMDEIVKSTIDNSVVDIKKLTNVEIDIIRENIKDLSPILNVKEYTETELNSLKLSDIILDVKNQVKENFDKLKETTTEESIEHYAKKLLLFLLDTSWQEHLVAIEELKQGSNLNALAQKDPLQEFKMESYKLFDDMMEYIRTEVLKTFMGIYEIEVASKQEN